MPDTLWSGGIPGETKRLIQWSYVLNDVRKWKLCAEPACGTAVPYGTVRCIKHTRQKEQEQSGWAKRPSKRNLRYNGSHKGWRDLRLRVIRRDQGLCQGCKGKGLIRSGQEVDHIDSEGGDDMDNLQFLCLSCHRAKTIAESVKARRENSL